MTLPSGRVLLAPGYFALPPGGHALAHQLLNIAGTVITQFRPEPGDLLERHADANEVSGVAEDLDKFLVEAVEPEIGVINGHALGHALEGRLEKRLPFPESFVRAAALKSFLLQFFVGLGKLRALSVLIVDHPFEEQEREKGQHTDNESGQLVDIRGKRNRPNIGALQ